MDNDIDAGRMNDNRVIRSLIACGLFFLLYLAVNYAYGESDFYLEAKTDSSDTSPPFGTPPKITKLEIQNNSEGYKRICPSLQCKIDYKDKLTFFTAPTPDVMNIAYTFDFRLQDDITHADLGAKKKEFIEQYTLDVISCHVDNIIEENGQELYYCHDNFQGLMNKFDKTSYGLNKIAMYDAKNDILKISGNFTRP